MAITAAFVVTWSSLCAVMLYSDPRLWIILVSSVVFTLLRVVGVPMVATHVKAFNTFSDMDQLFWSNTLVSMVHSTLSSILALYTLLYNHSIDGDYVNRASYTEFVTTAVSTGYFAYDLWDYVLNRLYIKSPGIVVHHIVILICYTAALTKTVGVPLLSLALVCELHSALMHLRKLLSMSDYSMTVSSTYNWVWNLQWLAFLVFRTIPHCTVTVLTYQARGLFHQQAHFFMAFGGMLFINALNAQLFRGVYRAYRKDLVRHKSL